MAGIKRRFALLLIGFFEGTRFFGVKNALLRFAGVPVGSNVRVVGPLHLGGVAKLSMGDNVWIGRMLSIEGNGTVTIGNNVDIGPNVTIGTGGHEIGPACHRAGRGVITSCEIGSGVWVGQNSLIVNDCVVGPGSVIAAGSVVIGDVPGNVMVAGVPARVKKNLPVDAGAVRR